MRESHGAYYLTFWQGGKQRWKFLSRDIGVAFALYRELHGMTESTGRTVRDLVEKFEREVMPAKRPNTQRAYRCWIPAILKTWGDMQVTDMEQQHLAVFLDTYPHKVTANRVVTLLVTMFKKAVRWGWIKQNLLAGIERNEERRRRRIISDDEWRALLEAADGQYGPLLKIARFTALRRSDVARLTYGHIQNGRLVVTTQKTAAPVSIQIRGELEEAIAELKRGILPFPTRRLFTVEGGRPLTTNMLGYHFDRIRQKAGLRAINFHDIRRTRLTEVGEKYGKGFAQRLAAHADMKTTEGYIVPEVVCIDWPDEEIRGAS